MLNFVGEAAIGAGPFFVVTVLSVIALAVTTVISIRREDPCYISWCGAACIAVHFILGNIIGSNETWMIVAVEAMVLCGIVLIPIAALIVLYIIGIIEDVLKQWSVTNNLIVKPIDAIARLIFKKYNAMRCAEEELERKWQEQFEERQRYIDNHY